MTSARIDRRTALKLGTALAGAAVAGPARGQQPVELVFTFGPDNSGTLARLIEEFNTTHAGRIQVRHRVMSESTDTYFQQLESDFEVGSADVDVIGADVIWTATLVEQGWVRDLSGRFTDDFDPRAFLPAAMNSTVWHNRIWGVPWFTAVGMLYYRKDLLEQAGITTPPVTWDALKAAAKQVQEASGTRYGFVFQGDEYEGGVTNALEYIWSAGGRVMSGNVSVAGAPGIVVMDPNVVNVDSADSARGLNIARSMVAEGAAPEEVVEFREQDCVDAFLAGDAVFMRNWPFAYGLLGGEGSRISAEQVGVAEIPTAAEGGRHFSCLGGWNLMVSSASRYPDAAWEFVRYAAAAEQQVMRAVEGGFLPTLHELYDNPAVVEGLPIAGLGRAAVEDARTRPISPVYMSASRRIARAYNQVLRGEIDGAQAVRRLQRELRTILRRYR